MIEPKQFYRNFDQLLKTIRSRKKGEDFICSILLELQEIFGSELHIGNLRVYEERADEFVLVRPFGKEAENSKTRRIKKETDVVQELLKHGSYIYDNFDFVLEQENKTENMAVPAAIVIRSPEKSWIAAFDLLPGWSREEVIFSLNAVRTAINYRLFADAINTELEQAAQIQSSLLPRVKPRLPGYEFAARSQATEIVGGDFYDFHEFDDDMFGVAIGDASGHGLPAALLVRDIVIGLRIGIEKHMKMVHTMQKLNSVIYRSSYSSRFVSLFYGEIERDGHLIYVNAGHPPPFVVHGEQVTDLNATGTILGALPEIALHRSFARMQQNSVLVLYTDGLFERENRDEELYKITRLKQLVMRHQEKTPEKILETVFEDVDKFGGHNKWEDDSTLVIIKRMDK